jgi:hypothetical protein
LPIGHEPHVGMPEAELNPLRGDQPMRVWSLARMGTPL